MRKALCSLNKVLITLMQMSPNWHMLIKNGRQAILSIKVDFWVSVRWISSGGFTIAQLTLQIIWIKQESAAIISSTETQTQWIIEQNTLISSGVSYLNLEIKTFLLLSQNCKETLSKARLVLHLEKYNFLYSFQGHVRSPRQMLAKLWPLCSRVADHIPAHGSGFVFFYTENTQIFP